MILTIDARKQALNYDEARLICNVLRAYGYEASCCSGMMNLLSIAGCNVNVLVENLEDADKVLVIAERTAGKNLVPLKCA